MNLGWNPGRRDLYEDPGKLEATRTPARRCGLCRMRPPRPLLPYYGRLSEILQRNLNAALSGRRAPEEALSAAEREMRASCRGIDKGGGDRPSGLPGDRMGEDRLFPKSFGDSPLSRRSRRFSWRSFLPVAGTVVDSLYRDVTFLPRAFVGAGNYLSLASDPAFRQSLRFTLLFVLASVPLELALGLSFALLLHRPSPARGFLRACVLIPWAVPAAVSGKVFQLVWNFHYGAANYLVRRLGLSDEPLNWLGVGGGRFFALVAGDVWKTAPFAAILFLAGLSGIPGGPVPAGGGGPRRPLAALHAGHAAAASAGRGRGPPVPHDRRAARLRPRLRPDRRGAGGKHHLPLPVWVQRVRRRRFRLRLRRLRRAVPGRARPFRGVCPDRRVREGALVNGERRVGIGHVAGAAAMIAFCLAPIAYMALTAASRRPDFLAPGAGFAFTPAHFLEVLRAESLHFPEHFRNSLAVSGSAPRFSVSVAAPAAYAVARLALPGRGPPPFRRAAVSMFPQVSLVGYLFRLMGSLGWINTYVALVLPYTAWTLPLSLWILTSYFSRIPRDIDRAALIDGCGPLGSAAEGDPPGGRPRHLLHGAPRLHLRVQRAPVRPDAHDGPPGAHDSRGHRLLRRAARRDPLGLRHGRRHLDRRAGGALAFVFQRRIIQGLTRGAVKE